MQQAEMAKATTLHRVQQGHVIASKNELALHMYMVLHGRVDVTTDHTIQKDGAIEWIVGGDVDVVLLRPGGVDVVAASSDVSVAFLSKYNIECILRQSFHPTSSSVVLNKPFSHHQQLRLAVKPVPKLTTSGPHRPRSIAHMVNMVAKTTLPRNQRDRIKHTRIIQSKLFTEAYMSHDKTTNKATTSRNDSITSSTSLLAAAATEDANAMSSFQSSTMMDMDETREDNELQMDTTSTTSSTHLPHCNSSSTSTSTRATSVLLPSKPTTSSPAFEFFPTFADRFDPAQLDVLFLPSVPFPMDEMRLTDIGPPCPDAPSFVMPPRVAIDTAVLLVDQLQLLCKTSHQKAPPDKRRQSCVDTQSSSTAMMPLVFHGHFDAASESNLEPLAELTLSQFVDGRKTVTAAAVKGQKMPFASVSLYCADWNQPPPPPPPPPTCDDNVVESDVVVAVAEDNNEDDVWLQTVGTHHDKDNHPTSIKEVSTQLEASGELCHTFITSPGGTSTTTRKLSGRRRSSQRTQSRRGSGYTSQAMNNNKEDATDEVGDSVPRQDGGSISVVVGEEEERVDGMQQQQQRRSDADGSIDLDTKHVFKVESSTNMNHLPAPPRQRLQQRLPSNDPLSRRNVYRKLVQQVSTVTKTTLDDMLSKPTMHLEQLEIEQKLRDQVGKAMLQDGNPCPWRIQLQQRMEAVLTSLQLSAQKKLEIVIKYTSVKHSPHLEAALDLWEKAANCIMDREATLQRVYEFELVASDPRRLFQTISTLRLKEQRQRDRLFLLLHNHTDFCTKVLDDLFRQFGDVVLFQDRSYSDKMHHDYTEVLYDLEQVRLRMYFGGISVPTQSQDRPSMHNIAATIDPVNSHDRSTPPVVIIMPSKTGSMAGGVGATSVPSCRGEKDHQSDDKDDGHRGHLVDIVKARGEATLAALKADLRRQHLQDLAAKAQAKLEVEKCSPSLFMCVEEGPKC
ncbi:hypothetical protein, variant 1 [Aphanomyces astaci]|uniref:Cyclic nucleotide-binding domain-containing protein n=1 Tax=Aphanomyces astaci TaxID=112090 RepID=W4FDM8_APHAT|nr:hypothetical protein, variant 1 [Aphanomyces astaci]ETV65582.1 hypothetical protein, variant 1 [Aphanomyces astaci]|eukprot:XP_009844924.1 hypothetical protein, variant 1 [Aphanomyces astaci]